MIDFNKVRNINVNSDLKIIETFYWKGFSALFPELTKEKFLSYCSEDTYGGWEDTDHTHAAGRRELKVLYALLRIVKPTNILEVGTHKGDSTNHILLAADNNKNNPTVTTVDVVNHLGSKKLHNYPVTVIINHSLNILNTNKDYDFIMQDGDHSYAGILQELSMFKQQTKLKHVWGHDYYLGREAAINSRGVGMAYDELGDSVFSEWAPFIEDNYQAGFIIGKV
jgi:hypothetical protein